MLHSAHGTKCKNEQNVILRVKLKIVLFLPNSLQFSFVEPYLNWNRIQRLCESGSIFDTTQNREKGGTSWEKHAIFIQNFLRVPHFCIVLEELGPGSGSKLGQMSLLGSKCNVFGSTTHYMCVVPDHFILHTIFVCLKISSSRLVVINFNQTLWRLFSRGRSCGQNHGPGEHIG